MSINSRGSLCLEEMGSVVSADISLHMSAGSQWWSCRRSPAAGCLVIPSRAPLGSVAAAGPS